MSCDDCYTSNTCRGEHGTFDDKHQQDYVPKDDSCEDPNEWEYVHTVNPRNSSTESYDEIKGSYKRIYLNSWFQEEPDDHILQSCEDRWGPFYATPTSVEYYVRHPSSEDDSEYKFEDPRPKDDGTDENFIMNTALDIAPVVYSHPLVSAGAAVIKNYIGSTSNSSVELRPYDNDSTRQVLWWDLDYDNHEDWPTAPCDTTGVRFDVAPGTNSGDHTVDTWARYTMSVHDYLEGYECVCDETTISGYTKTTDWLQNSATFTFNG